MSELVAKTKPASIPLEGKPEEQLKWIIQNIESAWTVLAAVDDKVEEVDERIREMLATLHTIKVEMGI
jgi:hypothetical protein